MRPIRQVPSSLARSAARPDGRLCHTGAQMSHAAFIRRTGTGAPYSVTGTRADALETQEFVVKKDVSQLHIQFERIFTPLVILGTRSRRAVGGGSPQTRLLSPCGRRRLARQACPQLPIHGLSHCCASNVEARFSIVARIQHESLQTPCAATHAGGGGHGRRSEHI